MFNLTRPQIAIGGVSGRAVATTAAIAVLVAVGTLLGPMLIGSADAQEPELYDVSDATAEPDTTILSVQGSATRNLKYNLTVGRFTVSVLRDSVLSAVNVGNTATQAIADAVGTTCSNQAPQNFDINSADTCVSPQGLQTTQIRIYEEYSWTEQGRTSQGFRYENGLSIAVRGTAFAGGLIAMVVKAGGDHVRFDGIDFVASNRARVQDRALLAAIDDANATADSIADHMGYEIVRIVEINPLSTGAFASYRAEETAVAMSDSAEYVPTPVFGGNDTVTATITIIYELRKLPDEE